MVSHRIHVPFANVLCSLTQACNFLEPSELLKMAGGEAVEEAVEKVNSALNTLYFFKQCYEVGARILH